MVPNVRFLLVLFFVIAGIALFFFFDSIFGNHKRIDFNSQIRPIINNKCISCHGGVKQSGGFSLLFQDEALQPSESGKRAIVPGKPEESEMITRVKHADPEFRMPLEKDPLSEEEIALLSQWIEEGAEWGEHWAFQKLRPIEPPDIFDEWIRNDIDRFVLQKLEQKDLQTSPQADKATLLRRVSLDLTGLPPTVAELNDFLHDDSEEAYEKVVDRLLASPHYGERWTSMWMDVARYADSRGYTQDIYRSVWKYRDWLIKSFNDDKAYDQFIIEQLAGDLLPDATDEQMIATAFNRHTLTNDEGGTDNNEFRVSAVIDRVNTTWNAFQGTTMECVQCHSHPYDPIRHDDFYRSYAFFNNTSDEDAVSDAPNLVTFASSESKDDVEAVRQWVIDKTSSDVGKARRAREFMKLIKLKEPKIHAHSFDDLKNGSFSANSTLMMEDNAQARLTNVPLNGATQMLISYRSNSGTGSMEIRLGHPQGLLLGKWKIGKTEPPRRFEIAGVPITPKAGVHNLYFKFSDPGKKGVACAFEWVVFYEKLPGEDAQGYADIEDKFFRLLNDRDAIETAVMVEREGEYRRKTHVFERGNWMVHGEEVGPGIPEAWNDMPEGAPANRLGLARWLTHKDNPLTARVMVNRLWAQLFGIGIVETLEDFGSQGFPPSHPELLDFLAVNFMDEDAWHIKPTLKRMVMSAAYQQSSKSTIELLDIDPKNRLLARGPRFRLTAEQIRDQILAVSGLLSDKMYGPSVMPLQPDGIWDGAIGDLKWETSKGEDKYRRALYTYWRRSRPYPSLVAFDTPSREVCVNRRINTNTPLQALVTLNDPVLIEAALALAERMRKGDVKQTVKGQITEGYRLAMATEIGADKLEELRLLYEDAYKEYQAHPQQANAFVGKNDIELASLTVVANVIMNLDEFISKR